MGGADVHTPLGVQRRATLGRLVTAIAVIPPIALLPVLFILFGLGETAKVALTLIANSWGIMLRVALPQAMIRLIAADFGPGYRIFLVRR